MAQKTTIWPVIGIALVQLILIFGLISYAVPNEFTANVDFSSMNARFDSLDEKFVAKEVEETEAPSTIVLTKTEHEDEVTEATALTLATESIMSRDFRRAVFDLLEAEGRDIESYKDITDIKVVDSDYGSDDVDFDLKVYYFLDGDEDETERARLEEFTIEIDDLDFDDDFEDAEVDESYMDSLAVLRIYD